MAEKNIEDFVLCVGLPRSGSYSLKLALDEILEGKAHHGFTFFESAGPSEAKFYARVCNREDQPGEWRQFFEERGYQGCLDIPCIMRYKVK